MAAETVLLADNLLLRTPRASDIDALHSAARESIQEVGRWLPWCHEHYALSDAEAWVQQCLQLWSRDEAYPFFIFDTPGEQFVGGCAINEIDRGRMRANLGYWVRSSRHRGGYASRAARRLARWAFDELGLQRLEIVAAFGNTPSQKTALRIGAVCEGLARHRLRIYNVPHDAYVYSLIPSDARRWE